MLLFNKVEPTQYPTTYIKIFFLPISLTWLSPTLVLVSALLVLIPNGAQAAVGAEQQPCC